MANLTPESESSATTDMAWMQLLPDNKPKPMIVRIDETPTEMNPEVVQLNSTERTKNPPRRRESLIGTFQRTMRMSLKAVSESSGPLSR